MVWELGLRVDQFVHRTDPQEQNIVLHVLLINKSTCRGLIRPNSLAAPPQSGHLTEVALAHPATYPLMLITHTLLMQTMPRPSVACTNLIAYPIKKIWDLLYFRCPKYRLFSGDGYRPLDLYLKLRICPSCFLRLHS